MKSVCYLVSALFIKICYGEIMKKLVLFIFLSLLWCNVGYTKNCISIEKICLGDSAIDFFSMKELKDSEYYYFDDKNFVTSVINEHPKFKTFETIEIDYNKNDPKYKILFVNGRIFNTRKECLVKLDEFNNLISNILNTESKYSKTKNFSDELGESFIVAYDFKVNNKVLSLQCYQWSKRMQSRFTDNFTMSITTKKFQDFQQGIVSTF